MPFRPRRDPYFNVGAALLWTLPGVAIHAVSVVAWVYFARDWEAVPTVLGAAILNAGALTASLLATRGWQCPTGSSSVWPIIAILISGTCIAAFPSSAIVGLLGFSEPLVVSVFIALPGVFVGSHLGVMWAQRRAAKFARRTALEPPAPPLNITAALRAGRWRKQGPRRPNS